jgi:hypothetical protein
MSDYLHTLKEKQNIKQAMDQLKMETAQELGLGDVKIHNGGNLASNEIGKVTGKVGGTVVKKLIAMGEEELIKQNKGQ